MNGKKKLNNNNVFNVYACMCTGTLAIHQILGRLMQLSGRVLSASLPLPILIIYIFSFDPPNTNIIITTATVTWTLYIILYYIHMK